VTRARAPGKLILSGAYSVLWGAPALVTAVARFATADTTRPPVHVSEEVALAAREGVIDAPCFVDAGPLRTDDGAGGTRKLGLGSSAAILSATLLAKAPALESDRPRLFESALDLHRRAQGGGSGADVAASVFGGTLRFLRGDAGPLLEPTALPAGLALTIFYADASASTQEFVAQVRRFAGGSPAAFAPLLSRARAGAEDAARAQDARAFTRALDVQFAALAELGASADVAIVTPAVAELAALAREEHGAFGPSGAGGGDVAFFAAEAGPSRRFVERAQQLGLTPLDATIHAPGASLVEAAV
jgi:phosphomevalonate kinase